MQLNNLHKSYGFIAVSLDYLKHAMVEGVDIIGNRGVPNMVKQEEIPSCKKQKLSEAAGALTAATTYPLGYP